MPRTPVTEMKASVLWDALTAKLDKHGADGGLLYTVFERLIGISPEEVRNRIESGAAYGSLFPPAIPQRAAEVKGTVCGVKVEAVEDPLMRQIRAVDLIVDKLAKGRELDKLLPPDESGEEERKDPVPVMTFEIDIRGEEISGFSSPDGAVTIIPFTGRTSSPLFEGEIRPGAADVQTQKPGMPRRLAARYLFHGHDADGSGCSLFVENVGETSGEPGPIRAIPVFLTDSKPLAAYFRGKTFRSEVHGREGGVRILIFEDKPEKGD
ncbi:MAG: DUF3237 family protein [Ruminococcaceae bacterium]|nr:DUF3237 family protein [Oscillospiraceae bacterium]